MSPLIFMALWYTPLHWLLEAFDWFMRNIMGRLDYD